MALSKPEAASGPKTLITPDQAREIVRHYNLTLRGLWPLARGTINSNYLIDTDAGPLFLRVSEGKLSADAQFEAGLIWHLGSRGVRTPSLWRTRSGQPFVPWASAPGLPPKPVMLMSWAPGQEKSEAELSDAEARHVGQLLATLHLGAATFPGQREGIYTLRHIVSRLERVRHDPRAQADLGGILGELQGEATRLVTARHRELPHGLCHGDLFPDNLLLPRRLPRTLAELVSCGGWILDLEQAATLPYIYDVAVALLAFCAPVPAAPPEGAPEEAADAAGGRVGPLQQERAKALLAGYQELRALGDLEWQGLYDELRWAALRFTVTRLTDVHGYGSGHRAAPEATPAEAAAEAASATGKPPRRLTAVRHSKDYRDFLWRWRELAKLDPAALVAALR